MFKSNLFKFCLVVCLITLVPTTSYASNQKEMQLSIDVQNKLHESVISPIKPHLIFASPKLAKEWLDDMSTRLKKFAKNNSMLQDEMMRTKLLTIIQYEAIRAGLNPQMVLSIITVESQFNDNVVSKAGAIGLMQVMPFWQKKIGTFNQNLLNIQTNIRYGCTILRYYLELEHGSYFAALSRYNGSHGQIKYSNLVFNAYNKYWKTNN